MQEPTNEWYYWNMHACWSGKQCSDKTINFSIHRTWGFWFDNTLPRSCKLVFASLYVFAAILPLEMPGRCFHWLSFLIWELINYKARPVSLDCFAVHKEVYAKSAFKLSRQHSTLLWHDFLSLAVLILFFTSILSCGRIFHSMAFTFGLCGPLALQPSQAIITDKCYNGAFLLGRCSLMFFF